LLSLDPPDTLAVCGVEIGAPEFRAMLQRPQLIYESRARPATSSCHACHVMFSGQENVCRNATNRNRIEGQWLLTNGSRAGHPTITRIKLRDRVSPVRNDDWCW